MNAPEAQELNEPSTKVDRLPAKLLAVYTRDVADGVGGETFAQKKNLQLGLAVGVWSLGSRVWDLGLGVGGSGFRV